jgi:uncharacterized protein (DUF1697 family)
MPILIAMLRGVNVGGHHKIKMDVLRALCDSLKFECAQTYLQSGNVVFRCGDQNMAKHCDVLETAIEGKLGFRPAVVCRTIPELRKVIAHNPFAKRSGLEPSKLAVTFLGATVTAAARKALLAMEIAPEELRVNDRELYIYFPNGQARTKLSWPRVEKIIGPSFTSRNWNTVTNLLKLAESIETNS